MSEKFIIKGGKSLKGEIKIRGCKNAATPILAATLLTDQPCFIDNLPLVKDIFNMIELIKDLGAKIEWVGKRKLKIEAKHINPNNLNQNLISKMRSSILLLGPLLARFGKVFIVHPGGCIIGARPLDTHFEAFKKMGVEIKENKIKNKTGFCLRVKKKQGLRKLQGNEIILEEFSVTATENILMASTLAQGKTTIKIAACEPHVQDLICFLKKMGVKIQGEGSHTITINPRKRLRGANHFLIYDAIEAGTFIIAAAATKGTILVKNCPVSHLDLVLTKLQKFGLPIKILTKNSLIVYPWKKIEIKKIQALPYPGIATDLQSIFGVLATQAQGTTLIHDPLYEGRLKYLEELNKMGADIIICDPHRAIINGPTQLYGINLESLDLRSGATLIIAGLIAKGTTTINNISQIDRGYEIIEKRLQKLGADIKRVSA